jgi:hypothetical protein
MTVLLTFGRIIHLTRFAFRHSGTSETLPPPPRRGRAGVGVGQ